jgi:hypothetical protein
MANNNGDPSYGYSIAKSKREMINFLKTAAAEVHLCFFAKTDNTFE